MNRHYRKIINQLIFVNLFIIPVCTFSQTVKEGSEGTREKQDSLSCKNALFTGMGFGSNFIYLGSTISGNQPYGYGSLTYGYNNELFVSISAVHLSNIPPFIAFYTGTLNYSHTFNSWFDISAALSRYQVAASLGEILFNSFNYGDLTLGLDWNILYSRISGGILFSDEKNGYLQIRNSRYFETPGFTKKKLYLTFDPFFNFLFGTIIDITTSEGTTVTLSPPYKKGGKYGQKKPVTNISHKFGLMEADIGFPISINTNKFTLETEPGYIFPISGDNGYSGPKGFYLMISAYFRII